MTLLVCIMKSSQKTGKKLQKILPLAIVCLSQTRELMSEITHVMDGFTAHDYIQEGLQKILQLQCRLSENIIFIHH